MKTDRELLEAAANEIDTGDEIRHEPSGEDWLVAFVENGLLWAVGWPCTAAKLSDCKLTEKATPERRQQLLLDLSAMSSGDYGNDPRKEYARRRLAAAAMAG